MFYELCPDSFEDVRDFFSGFTHSLSIKAVMAGNNSGRVFADDPEHPNWAFAMTIEGYLLGGDPENAAARRHLADFFKEEIFSGKTYLDDDTTMTLGVDPIGWEDYLPELIPTHEIEKLDRYQYICRKVKFNWDGNLPDGSRIFRRPFFDPEGRMTICQWYTAKNTDIDYRIGPRETKLETYTWTVPDTFASQPATIKATLYYSLVPSSVGELLKLPAYSYEAKPVNSASLELSVK